MKDESFSRKFTQDADGEISIEFLSGSRSSACSALETLEQLDAQISQLGKDAHREGDDQTVWFCQAQKKENAKLREELIKRQNAKDLRSAEHQTPTD